MTFEKIQDLLASPLGQGEAVREYGRLTPWTNGNTDLIGKEEADAALLEVANARGKCGECRYRGVSEVDPSGKEWCGRGVTWGEYELNVPADFGCSLFERRQS
jgi:hypothetical protein